MDQLQGAACFGRRVPLDRIIVDTPPAEYRTRRESIRMSTPLQRWIARDGAAPHTRPDWVPNPPELRDSEGTQPW
jgi:hypothetical protein